MIENNKRNLHPQFYLNQFYHIYNKAVADDLLFYSSENYKYFLKRYDFYLNEIVDTYAFCLIPNHIHFLISPVIDDPHKVSRQFQKLFISYSMALNKQLGRKGNLFQKNFKRRIVSGENDLKNTIHYIHVNPSHHFLDKNFENYTFSSYRIMVNAKPTHLKRTEVLDWFGGVEKFIYYHMTSKREVWNKIYEA